MRHAHRCQSISVSTAPVSTLQWDAGAYCNCHQVRAGYTFVFVFCILFLFFVFLTLSTLCVFFSYLLCHFVNSWVMKAQGNISTRKNQRKMRERWSPKRGKHAITKHIINFLMLQQVTSKVPILRSECCNICFLENRANERGE